MPKLVPRALGALVLAAFPLGAVTPEAPLAAADTQGFLYGRLTLEDGKVHQGRLRWNGDEEAFWGDLFHSSKPELPYVAAVPKEQRRRRRPIEVFGVTVAVTYDEDWEDRQFAVRFGDIRRIEPGADEDAVVILKSGTRYAVRGGSNDVDAKIVIWEDGKGDKEREIDWDDVRSIDFLPAPAGLRVAAQRIYGTVKSAAGTFRGFVQWDQEECLTTDELDGEVRGTREVSLRFGDIRSIERRRVGGGSLVTLKNGRSMVLTGTNDVDDGHRGVYVEDPRYGRVLVSWDVFERLDFAPPPGSGPAYADFRPGRPLQGRVTTADGKVLSGRIAYDVDEAETAEILDGGRDDVIYTIPFALVSAVEPQRDGASRVRLRSGEVLELEGTSDVGEDSGGVLVLFQGKGKPAYLPWKRVRRIDFE